MNNDDDLKLIQALNSEAARSFIGDMQKEQDQQIQKLSMSFEMEIQPCMEEQLQELREFHIKVIKDFKPDDILIKLKYSQPPYRERLHSKDVVFFRICRIRNRQNSGHGFKK